MAILGAQAAIQKNRKKTVPGPERPDQTQRAQGQPKTKPKTAQDPKMEKRISMENKAPEHQKNDGAQFRMEKPEWKSTFVSQC